MFFGGAYVDPIYIVIGMLLVTIVFMVMLSRVMRGMFILLKEQVKLLKEIKDEAHVTSGHLAAVHAPVTDWEPVRGYAAVGQG